MSSAKKGGKMQALIGYRVKVTLNDSRSLIGQMLAFDAKFNLVLAECEEYRRVKHKKSTASSSKNNQDDSNNDNDDNDDEEEMKRMLGLVILRGETVVTLTVEGPPPVADDAKGPQIGMGPGMGAPAGRGMGLAPPTMRQAPQSFPPPGMPPPGMPGMMPGFAPPPGFPGMAPPPGFGGR